MQNINIVFVFDQFSKKKLINFIKHDNILLFLKLFKILNY